jgi:hypothetical protein
MFDIVKEKYTEVGRRAGCFIESNSTTIALAIGATLVVGGLTEMAWAQSSNTLGSVSEADYQDGLVRGAVANLFALIEGAFGALIMVVAGLGAIVAAAMGAYRAAVGMLVVAVGAFILRSLVSLFFGADFPAGDGRPNAS